MDIPSFVKGGGTQTKQQTHIYKQIWLYPTGPSRGFKKNVNLYGLMECVYQIQASIVSCLVWGWGINKQTDRYTSEYRIAPSAYVTWIWLYEFSANWNYSIYPAHPAYVNCEQFCFDRMHSDNLVLVAMIGAIWIKFPYLYLHFSYKN